MQKTSWLVTYNTVANGQSYGALTSSQSVISTPVVTKYVGELYEQNDTVGTKFVFLGGQRIAAIDTVTGSPQFYLGDHLGSTHVITNTSGNRIELLEYDPYGKITRHDSTSGNTRLAQQQFTGKKLDDETGLVYFGARYYDPSLGRFITPDTIVQNPSDPQTLNRYSYCGNNPINRTDPTGHKWSWKKFWHAAVGAIVGVALGILLGPAGLGMAAWAAGMIGGAVGGAITGGLDGGWKGALMGGLIGGTLGGLGGWASGWKNVLAKNLVLGGMAVGGIGYTAATKSWDSFAGGLLGASIASISCKAFSSPSSTPKQAVADIRSESVIEDDFTLTQEFNNQQDMLVKIGTAGALMDKAGNVGNTLMDFMTANVEADAKNLLKSAAAEANPVAKAVMTDMARLGSAGAKAAGGAVTVGLALPGYFKIYGAYASGNIGLGTALEAAGLHTAGVFLTYKGAELGAGVGLLIGRNPFAAGAGAAAGGLATGLAVDAVEKHYFNSWGIK